VAFPTKLKLPETVRFTFVWNSCPAVSSCVCVCVTSNVREWNLRLNRALQFYETDFVQIVSCAYVPAKTATCGIVVSSQNKSLLPWHTLQQHDSCLTYAFAALLNLRPGFSHSGSFTCCKRSLDFCHRKLQFIIDLPFQEIPIPFFLSTCSQFWRLSETCPLTHAVY
jgi:hypothetical protein